MASLVYLVVVYMRHNASMAPGLRGMVCGRSGETSSLGSAHLSGSGHSKVMTTLQ